MASTTILLGFTLMSLLAMSQGARSIAGFKIGKCPNIPPKANFDLSQYLGLWYSYEQFDALFQLFTACVTADYTILAPGKIRVVHSGYRDLYAFGHRFYRKPTTAVGEAYIVDPAVPGGLNLNVRFGKIPTDDGTNYLVVDTDYTKYSLVYSCSQYWFFKFEIAWILTRERGVRPDNIDALKSELAGYGVNINNFKSVKQSDCN